MENPTRGVTAEDYLSGTVPAPVQTARIIASDYVMPSSWQSSIGFQKQLGSVMGFDVDLTYLDERNQVRGRDPNLFYDPVTGYNLDPNRYGRPNPIYGEIQWMESKGATESLLLASSFTRRFRDNFQAGVTYTRTLRRNDNTTGFGIQANNQFDLDGDWSRSTDFQRDTFRANGIVNLPWQVTVGASFFYGSGSYYNATLTGRPYNKPGTNRLNLGAPITIPAAVARPLGRAGGDRDRRGVAAERAARAAALQGGHAPVEEHRQHQQLPRHAAGRGVQPLQPRQLRRLQHAAGFGGFRPAGGLVGQRLRAAVGPARLPFGVLNRCRELDTCECRAPTPFRVHAVPRVARH